MCTVTYIPKNEGGFFLTSNRDEHISRQSSSPLKRVYNGSAVHFPRDPLAGGTWIAMNENGRICCLLNGAFTNHVKKDNYNKSRGYILLDLVSSVLKPDLFFDIEDLAEVEPFTVLTLDFWKGELNYFSEFVWDGETRHLKYPDPHAEHIWSSSTLYNNRAKLIRSIWFEQFLEKNKNISKKDILGFHRSKRSQNQKINLLMKRENDLQTVSITQLDAGINGVLMQYHDLVKNNISEICTAEKKDIMVL